MNARSTARAIPLDEDTACRGCGYNLRGLLTDGRCPECGAFVWLSTAGEQLKYANPAWLADVARGAKGMLVALSSVVVVPGITLGPFALLEEWFGVQVHPVEFAICLVELAGSCGIGLWSQWLYASPEAGAEDRQNGIHAPRWRVRAGVIATLASVTLAGLIHWAPAGGVETYLLIALLALGSPFGVTGCVAMLAYARHSLELALRAGDPSAAASAAGYAKWYARGWFAAAAGGLMSLAAAPALFISFAAVPILMIFGVLILMLPHHIVSRLNSDLAQSRRRWQR